MIKVGLLIVCMIAWFWLLRGTLLLWEGFGRFAVLERLAQMIRTGDLPDGPWYHRFVAEELDRARNVQKKVGWPFNLWQRKEEDK